MDSLTVNVVTPNGLVYDHHAKIVVAKTTDGEIGIFTKTCANHRSASD